MMSILKVQLDYILILNFIQQQNIPNALMAGINSPRMSSYKPFCFSFYRFIYTRSFSALQVWVVHCGSISVKRNGKYRT